jgi:hypothetical protein
MFFFLQGMRHPAHGSEQNVSDPGGARRIRRSSTPRKKNNSASCSGFYYRPAALKSMTCLMGNTEKRVIHHGFELLNLNSDAHDYTHEVYQKYLENNYFIVPGEQAYWAHMTNSMLPGTPSKDKAKGLFNVFPLRLDSDDLHSKTSGGGGGGGGSNMGEYFFFRSGAG